MYGTLESVPNVCTILTRGLPFTYAAYLAFFDRKFSPANLHFHFYGVCSGCRTIYTTLSILIHTFAISSYLILSFTCFFCHKHFESVFSLRSDGFDVDRKDTHEQGMEMRWGSADMQSGGRLRGGRAALSEARRARREGDGDERTVSHSSLNQASKRRLYNSHAISSIYLTFL
jgi:hypothetical protein